MTNADDFSTYHSGFANIKTTHLKPEEIDRIVKEMYDAYQNNLAYIRFTQLRRIYPTFFWKLVAKQLPSVVLDLMKNGGGSIQAF